MPADTFLPTSALVRAAFGDAVIAWYDTSIYPWSPVFRANLRGVDGQAIDVVVKRAARTPERVAACAAWQRHVIAAGVQALLPVEIEGELTVAADDRTWIAYPYVTGAPWDGSIEQISTAGRALGALHRASASFDHPELPRFAWPEPTPESIGKDVAAIRTVCLLELPASIANDVAARWEAEFDSFAATTLPAIRDANLPWFPVTIDHRVTNLVFSGDGDLPTVLDFENGDVAPRLLDLGHSVLLIMLEITPNPGRLFDAAEWVAFRDAYLAEAPPLTERERTLWPTALTYTRLEFGTWHLTEGAEWDWPGNRPFLLDLLTLDEQARFPLVD